MIKNNEAQIRIAGTSVAFINEPTSNRGNQAYQIVDEEKRAWNMDSTLLVLPFIEPDDKFDIDYANGMIVFEKQKDRGEITITGEYFPTTVIGKVLSYNLNKTREYKTFFPVGALKETHIPGGLVIDGEIEVLEIQDPYFLDIFEKMEEILLDFQFGEHIESHWVTLDGLTTEHNGGELVKKKVTFRGNKD